MDNDEDSPQPKRRPGRPRKFDPSTLLSILEKYKRRICTDSYGEKIVSKSDKIWNEISKQTNNEKSAGALYAYVICNQDDVRARLWPDFVVNTEIVADDSLNLAVSLLERSTLDSTVENDTALTFTIHIPAGDFDKLVETRTIFKGKKKVPQAVQKFRKDEWQDFITQKIWKSTRLTCGFHFKYHYLDKEVKSGHFVGKCKCGSVLECRMERNEGIIAITCTTTKGSNECGKRYVRGPAREDIGEKLQTKSAHVFRAELANELMNDDDDQEPGHLPKTNVLKQIKHEVSASKYLDPDILKALEILSLFEMEGEIPWIGYKPFFVHYSTKLQRSLYAATNEKEHLCLLIDATASIIQAITRIDKSKSGPIFLYIAVVLTSLGQICVAQMLSERQTTGAIHFWLSQWVEQWGLTPPKEIVCDASRALLAAAIRAYTKNKTVNEYADEFLKGNLPACYIRIDVAHYIKLWVVSLKSLRREVAFFYKTSIGKLIMCRDIEEAEKIIRALLIISRSETCGKTTDGDPSACDIAKEYMEKVLTTAEVNDLDFDDQEAINGDEESESRQKGKAEASQWRNWGQRIDESAKTDIEKAPGVDINPHWAPAVADRLIAELKWLPLWSCTFRDEYGYGRCPASSANVEAEFRIIKDLMLKDMNPPLRADVFVRKHKAYLDGSAKIINAGLTAQQKSAEEPSITTNEHRAVDVDNCGINLERAESSNDDDGTNINHVSRSRSVSPNRTDVLQKAINCPACKNGHMPGGAHLCMICSQAVHAFEPCSAPASDSEEGFGQKRICAWCAVKPNAKDLIESHANENWGNQVAVYQKKRLVDATYRKLTQQMSFYFRKLCLLYQY